MTPDQINIAILLLEYAGWCALFGLTFAGAYRIREKRRK